MFRDDQNEWQQPHVLTKTTQYHQYLGQFLTDLLATFTKGGLIFRDDQNEWQQPHVLT